MPDNPDNDVVHLKPDHLPVAPGSAPTIEILRQLLEQMIENERRRLRNEYIRMAMVFFALLAAAVGGSLWFARGLLEQLRSERQLAIESFQSALQHTSGTGNQGQAPVSADHAAPQSKPGYHPALKRQAAVAPTNSSAPADIKQILANLEEKQDTLGNMLETQSARARSVLQKRDSELQVLHDRIQEVQRRIMESYTPENDAPKAVTTHAAVTPRATGSLSVTVSNAVKLRLPIPSP